jgi:hypothetical protein
MKIIIFTLIPVIIISFLYSKSLLPKMVYYVLVALVSLVGAYFFWKRYASIIMRDNMNYQEYDFPFDPNSVTTNSSTSSTDPWQTNTNLGTCVGDYCCSTGMSYDASLNQCVIGSSGTTTTSTSTGTTSTTTGTTSSTSSGTESFITESMINNVLTKTQPGKYKADYDLRNPMPSNN